MVERSTTPSGAPRCAPSASPRPRPTAPRSPRGATASGSRGAGRALEAAARGRADGAVLGRADGRGHRSRLRCSRCMDLNSLYRLQLGRQERQRRRVGGAAGRGLRAAAASACRPRRCRAAGSAARLLRLLPRAADGDDLVVFDPEDQGRARALRLPAPVRARPPLHRRLLPRARRRGGPRRLRAADRHGRARGHERISTACRAGRLQRGATSRTAWPSRPPRASPSSCTAASWASWGCRSARAGATRWGYPACPDLESPRARARPAGRAGHGDGHRADLARTRSCPSSRPWRWSCTTPTRSTSRHGVPSARRHAKPCSEHRLAGHNDLSR